MVMGRNLLTLFTLLCFTACTTLQPLPDAQPATIQQSVHAGDTVEVELDNGVRHVLKVESVGADALEGMAGGKRYRIPFDRVRSIGTRTQASGTNVWIVVGVLVVVGAVIAASGDGGGGGGGGY